MRRVSDIAISLLGERLQERDEYADHRRHRNRDQRQLQHQYEAHLGIVEYLSLTHIIRLSTFNLQLSTFNLHTAYPLTSPWMSSVHPLTITKRSSLNGSDIVTGETIIMPIARRMFDTMMSIAMNGR